MRTRQEAEPLENLVQIILITIDSKVRRLNKNNGCFTCVEMFFEALGVGSCFGVGTIEIELYGRYLGLQQKRTFALAIYWTYCS